MSSIGFREWEIWTNQSWFGTDQELDGYYYLVITPTLMAHQTLEFIREKTEAVRISQLAVNNRSAAYFRPRWSPPEDLALEKHERLRTTASLSETIRRILEELNALSICLDFPLVCNHLEYLIPPTGARSGKALIASRQSLSRGLAFEVDERDTATQKIIADFDHYYGAGANLAIAMKHYINGLLLLGLEDSFSGLLDAAFMQFYQACEIPCGNNHKIKDAKVHIARLNLPNAQNLQIVAHHVWQVRHGYFGHGNSSNLLYASAALADVYSIAKQVLVVRWLARQLIDIGSPSGLVLCREMRLYHDGHSDAFNGSVADLETSFRVPYAHRNVEVHDANGAVIVTYVLQ